MKEIQQLMEIFKDFGLVELVAFAKLVQFDDEEFQEAFRSAAIGDPELLVCGICERFYMKTRKERRYLLSLAKRTKKQKKMESGDNQNIKK